MKKVKTAIVYYKYYSHGNICTVEISTAICRGFPSTKIIGMKPKQARVIIEKINIALKSAGYKLPQEKTRIYLKYYKGNNSDQLIPSNLSLELPIAISILLCSNQIYFVSESKVINDNITDSIPKVDLNNNSLATNSYSVFAGGDLSFDSSISGYTEILPYIKFFDKKRRIVLTRSRKPEITKSTHNIFVVLPDKCRELVLYLQNQGYEIKNNSNLRFIFIDSLTNLQQSINLFLNKEVANRDPLFHSNTLLVDENKSVQKISYNIDKKFNPCKSEKTVLKKTLSNTETKSKSESRLQLPTKITIPTDKISYLSKPQNNYISKENLTTLNYLVGQESAKRACIISAGGGHHILFIGPIGSSKTLLAHSISEITPSLSLYEILDMARYHRVKIEEIEQYLQKIDTANKNLRNVRIFELSRPIIEIMHNTTIPGLLGNKNNPGLLAKSDKGFLLLDEISEISSSVLNSLKSSLDYRQIKVGANEIIPTRYTLIATSNTCPCGKDAKDCKCRLGEKINYIKKIPESLINRIDLLSRVSVTDFSSVSSAQNSLSGHINNVKDSIDYRNIVKKVREIQNRRYINENFRTNAEITLDKINTYCECTSSATKILHTSIEKLGLNGRDYIKILKIARTIADLESKEIITEENIYEALSYRTTSLRTEVSF
ncbi:MAG TPA: ATP-binding protein [Candidatus Dojkabacteria bacterium]|nr:ATP-binding protein [Candidatus Dojkabacteria bacterium]